MAGYIGSKASVVSSGVERKKTYSITGSTTSLTGLNYTVGKVHVYQNGVRLLDGTDYTATNGTSITLTVAAQSGDNVVVVSQASFQLSEHYTSTEADAEFVTKTGDTMSGNLNITGTVTADGLTMDTSANSAYAIELGANRTSVSQALGIIRGSWDDTVVAQINLAAGDDTTNKDNGRIFLRTASAGSTVNRLQVAENGDISFYEDTGTTAKFFWDASTERLGLGTSSPEGQLHLYSSSVGAPDADADDFVIEKTGDTGLSILSTTTGRIYFGDVASNDQGSIRYVHTDNSMRFETDSSEAMRIDSNGNVGIGTSSPNSYTGQTTLNINSTGVARLDLDINNSMQGYLLAESGYAGLFATGASNSLRFGTNNAERMRIDASGNLLVGKTTTESMGSATAGHTFYEGGTARHTVNAGEVMNINRLNSDGSIIGLYKSGSNVGNISVHGDSIVVGRGDTALAYNNSLDAIYPINTNGGPRDNAIDLGRSNVRFDDIYATNGTIQTSDFNEKQDIASLTATEMLVGKRISALFKTFRWKDSVAEKGDNARTHTGVIAQDVQAAFTAEGLDAGDYALFISSTWFVDAEGNEVEESTEGATSKTRMGIRYPELLSFVAAYNEQRFASIEARLTALEDV